MIKRIPIKGISRDPSGQISAEGMCAESLNVQLDMGEVAPMMAPKDAGTDYGNATFSGDVLYIHKGIGYENVITFNNGYLSYYPKADYQYSSGTVNHAIAGSIKSIIAVGNTLVVSADDMHYILWKENTYKYLGSKIPIPSISFRIGDLASIRTDPQAEVFPVISDNLANWISYVQGGPQFDYPGSTYFKNPEAIIASSWGKKAVKYKTQNETQQDFLDFIWGLIDDKMRDDSNNGKVIFPIFIRYAVRLYDNRCYAASIPILLGCELSKYYDIRIGTDISYSDTHRNTGIFARVRANVETPVPYSIYMEVANASSFNDWEDIVSSVDIFASPQFQPSRDALKVESLEQIVGTLEPGATTIDGIDVLGYSYENAVARIDPYYLEENQRDYITQNQSCYLAKSIPLNEFNNLSGEILLDDIDFSSDYLTNQDSLVESPGSMHYINGADLFKYNNRLLLTEAKQSLYHGYPFLPSAIWEEQGVLTPSTYVFHYYLRGTNGESIVISRNYQGTQNAITPQTAAIVAESATTYFEKLGPWIAYPDSRCYKVVVARNGIESVTLQMNAASQIDVAYAFLGFGNEPTFTAGVPQITENSEYSYENSIVVSKLDNPFLFTDIMTFTAGKVLNIAAVTTPLSEGQAGKFQIYAFTDEGVFALSVNKQGDFTVDDDTVSRDILLSKGAVTGIEQGVFFVAARGLLLLQGHNITKVSELMDGSPAEMESNLASNIGSYLDGRAVNDTAFFHEFIKDCKIAYDYANTRIVLFRTDTPSMYVYKFDTQSWHRMQAHTFNPVRALNSYPEMLLVEQNGTSTQKLFDYSIIAAGNETAMPGVVYTRELSLDQQDIYKTINRLKIRGRYADGHVKWALQGSNDGVNYHTLHSLRGPSWKWYRIAIVSMLDAQERISYIELDFTPKFTNRLR